MGEIVGIDKKKLDKDQYLVSLMQEGTQRGLLSAEISRSIPFDVMEILKEVMRMYTKGESSTLKVATAEGLMKSILYVLDLFLMKYPNPEDAICHLESCNIKTLYKEAMSYAKDYVEDTKKLYQAVEAKRVKVPNVVYNETFTEAIPNFFLNYDIIFSAHSTSSDLDYPLVFNDMTTKGITYIRKYLEAFALENAFCCNFSAKNITRILQSYGKSIGQNYEKVPINLFELIFNNIVFLTLLDKSYENLLISTIELQMIEEKLNLLDKFKIKTLIFSLLDRIITALEITNANLIDLIYRYSENMVERLNNALPQGHLANMIVLEETTHHRERVILDPRHKMNNRFFRLVHKKILECATVEDKVILLNKYVNSLDDFLDLLKTDCFYEKEYDYVFDTLGNLELCILAISGFKEYMLKGEEKLSTFLSKPITFKYDWEKAFIDWLKKLDKKRIQDIELLVYKNLASEIV
ncbi:DUF6179 domain-containing protein [Clostridium formicaceticum]|uniref:Uncharacterized protein n=1 Tax=Clostridium formicaceticum TaxID=1497 RepID=A0AAC9RI06_9CLOT|nr:DUF6179 domain-containing protein [Clostridium formicaceticum]AOY75847.1 hypothetical protein BJL90_08035 [Clostridium formicaceticum]ARE86182.1 hypothetical protein CLFO_05040 [Clostridium formicaceticum]